MKYENIDVDSEIFLTIEKELLERKEEEFLAEIRCDIVDLVESLKKYEIKLNEYDHINYKERISVI